MDLRVDLGVGLLALLVVAHVPEAIKIQDWSFFKSLIFASEASFVNLQKKTFGYTFLPLINSFEFLQILAIYSIKRITKNQKEFSRGKKVSPKVFF